jgi:predicted AlkP superfamily phosphohydrolase/phosphomutase
MVLVEIGPDRLHHAFYADLDVEHPQHDPKSVYLGVGERYYALLDRELGELIALADDETAILVASDHGARPLRSAFRINEWLQREGHLVLHHVPDSPQPLQPEWVDWARTEAWAEGGYYARVFFNVRGREPLGSLAPSELPNRVERLRAALLDVTGPHGERWLNSVDAPASLYRQVRGFAPDLLAVFDQLNVRPIATVGSDGVYAARDDRDADACNHDPHGILVCAGAGVEARGDLGECAIQDVGVTALALLGVERPSDWLGHDRSRAS